MFLGGSCLKLVEIAELLISNAGKIDEEGRKTITEEARVLRLHLDHMLTLVNSFSSSNDQRTDDNTDLQEQGNYCNGYSIDSTGQIEYDMFQADYGDDFQENIPHVNGHEQLRNYENEYEDDAISQDYPRDLNDYEEELQNYESEYEDDAQVDGEDIEDFLQNYENDLRIYAQDFNEYHESERSRENQLFHRDYDEYTVSDFDDDEDELQNNLGGNENEEEDEENLGPFIIMIMVMVPIQYYYTSFYTRRQQNNVLRQPFKEKKQTKNKQKMSYCTVLLHFLNPYKYFS